jgi:hypothetical protein
MAIRPFFDTLREIERGQLLETLAETQQQVCEGVRETMKQGEIKITLKYRYESDGQLTVEVDVKHKVPQLPRGKTLFFLTHEGNLERDDPRQRAMDLRTVDAPVQQPIEAR